MAGSIAVVSDPLEALLQRYATVLGQVDQPRKQLSLSLHPDGDARRHLVHFCWPVAVPHMRHSLNLPIIGAPLNLAAVLSYWQTQT